MRRTLVLYAPAAIVVGLAWLRLEEPHAAVWRVVLLACLPLAPALARPAWLRAPALVASVLAALNLALPPAALTGASVEGARWLPPGLPAGVASGFLSFYDVALPFSPGAHPLMHGLILLAVFGFGLVLSLSIAARKPVAAAFALIAGAVWPATLDPGAADVVLGVVVLVLVLALLVGGGRRPARRPAQAAIAGAAACVIAAVAAASPAAARSGLLDWQRWDPYTHADAAVEVEYVWRSSYGGIHFPAKATTVFTVAAPHRPLYWRATTLPVFDGRGWVEDPHLAPPLRSRGLDVPRETEAAPLHAANARLVRERFTVEALRDNHLVAASVPVAYATADAAEIQYATDGTAFTRFGLTRGETWTAWSLVASPSPAALARSPARYAVGLATRFLAVAPRVVVPPFGAPRRAARIAAIFRTHREDRRIGPYAPLYSAAARVTRRARSPYAAAVALEAWFRLDGRFRYDEHPPAARGVPPLVDFVVRTRRGYCQHFAGAMTLMLRYLGVPARVGAGFTSGSYSAARREWIVTDRDAHTWVEAWFVGYGWLPFDPTPSRGGLPGSYSAASPGFDRAAVLGAIGGAALGLGALRGAFGQAAILGSPPLGAAGGGTSRRSGSAAWPLMAPAAALGAAAAALAALMLAKRLPRRRRRSNLDARAIARACRHELAAYLADQRIGVPRSATNAELGALVGESFGVEAAGLARSLDAARFGSAASASRAAERLPADLDAVLARVRRALPRGRRLLGLVSLRSLRLGA